MAHYQKIHPDAYKRYANRKNQCLIEVVPEFIQIWNYINAKNKATPQMLRSDF